MIFPLYSRNGPGYCSTLIRKGLLSLFTGDNWQNIQKASIQDFDCRSFLVARFLRIHFTSDLQAYQKWKVIMGWER